MMYQNKVLYLRWSIVSILVVILVSFGAALYVEETFSARIIYKKIALINAERQKLITEYHAEPITFQAEDTIAIAGLLVKRPHAKRVFIICHGFKHTKEHMGDFVTLFPDDTILFIDFRGQGQSEGQKISLGLNEHLDIKAAADYIKKYISPTAPLIGIGVSQGGAALLRATAYGTPFDAVVSDSAPSDFKYTVASILQRTNYIPFPIGWLALHYYEYFMGCSLSVSDYRHYASLITCPVLIMHDRNDHLINYYHAEKIYNAIGSSCKELWTAENTHHGRMFKEIPFEYKQKVEDFLLRCL